MVDSIDSSDIKRNPENYDDMIAKLEARENEQKAKLGEHPEEDAKKRLRQNQGRRPHEPVTDREIKVNPSDPHVQEVLKTVATLSHNIDTAIKQNPDANAAVLKGRVTLGKPERSPGSA
ncbi:MAG: hypothetical protein S4CHLAM81_01080 [Chlamydiales bacterium]|nr:hypothetical protein [Chlamydiales bacterium]MCH9634904.1 hypothetical protein [Chlamydiales bacterium]MCH9704116.1 hypothetical protein [Chlamydiota bacterium]